MKQLTDSDIEKMAAGDFAPDLKSVNRSVRAQLRVGRLIPPAAPSLPKCMRLDLHHYTEEQAWDAIMELAKSGVRDAIIITGASGILHNRFPQWACESLLSPYIISWSPINNGSFSVKFAKITSD
ncbi:MAG: Smr/MutS family protein [Alphaproteobacteria bacterium]|nr:Smr/MutS family protein [Alphaproteobacteria bacterium]